MRVLIVDDYLDTTDMLAHLVRIKGHEAWTANDGLSAVELAVEFEPHIVLLDIGMPIIDGYETARRMRQHVALAGTRIYAFTAGPYDPVRADEAGFVGWFSKPLKIDELLRVLEVDGEATIA